MLRLRVATAVVLALAFLPALFWLPPVAFAALMAVVVGYGAWEWSALAGLRSVIPRAAYTLALLALLVWLFSGWQLPGSGLRKEVALPLLLIAGAWWAVALLWVQGYPSSAVLWGNVVVCLAIGALVLAPLWLAISVLVGEPRGPWLVLVVVLIVALADIGAYFTGRAFGRHKLAPAVSPGKTWEGVLGGLASVALFVVALGAWCELQWKAWLPWAGVALATALASVLGDLLESMLKRHRGVKDSGTILPGHGGLLDRLDSLTAALPVFTLFYLILDHRL